MSDPKKEFLAEPPVPLSLAPTAYPRPDDATPGLASPSAAAPIQHQRYELLGVLGEGGMGTVYRARDTRLNRDVVIKRIRADLAQSPQMVDRLYAEAQAAAQLSHRHIVTIHDRDRDTHGEFLVFEHVDGPNLLQLLEKQGPLPLEQALNYVRQVGEALQAAHDTGIVHRDVKPSNILITSTGEAKLADFGLARLSEDSGQTRAGSVFGTIDYLAPELLRDATAASPHSDQYALAATLYQLLSGRSPRLIRGEWLAEPLRDAVLKALEEQPGQRFRRIADWLAALPGSVAPAAYSSGEDLALQLSRRMAQVRDLKQLAKRLVEEEHDYARAIAILEQLPAPQSDARLLQLAREANERVLQLDKEIRERVENLQTTGLDRKIHQLLRLQPHREDMHRLRQAMDISVSNVSLPDPLPWPASSDEVSKVVEEWSDHLGSPPTFENSIGMKFVLVPPGEFLMGSPQCEGFRNKNEYQHLVRITRPYYLGVYPVTQAEYEKVMGDAPSRFRGAELPVENVSWDDAARFCEKLSLLEQRTPCYVIEESGAWLWKTQSVKVQSGDGYRLPTEAEWEYACRAGTTTPFWFGSELNGTQANCDGNDPYGTTTEGQYLDQTTPVGKYGGNPFGLYDLHGNVWEWCTDWYAGGYYRESPTDDPTGPPSGLYRVCRGGGYLSDARYCRSAYRYGEVPSNQYRWLGFRPLLSPSGWSPEA